MNKESIIEIINFGGTISFPYKKKINDWYSDIKITKLGSDEYVIQPGWQKFADVEEAVNWFMDKCFTSKNVGYIQSRLMDKGIVTENSNLENPDKEIKDIFKKEGKLVDEEAKSFNIVVKPFPKIEDANNEINEISKDFTIDNMAEKLKSFKKKYLQLDPYISANFVFDTVSNGKPHEYRTGCDFSYINKELFDRYMEYNNDKTKYKHMEVTVKIGNSDYNRYTLNF